MQGDARSAPRDSLLASNLDGGFSRSRADRDATPTNTGQFVVAIDVGAFLDLDAFKAKSDEVWDTMKSSALLPGFDEIRLPGERTHQIEQENRARGVPIHPALAPALAQLAADLRIEPL